MNLTLIKPKRLFSALAGTFSIASIGLLVACGGGGGGGGVAGVGSGGTGFVTGFGSVIVDGISYDDSALGTIKREKDDAVGTDDVGRRELKLGQRLELEYSPNGSKDIVSAVTVASEITGRVTADSSTEIEVVGQKVRPNADPAKGPVTILDGYATFADITLTDRVEVHGILTTDTSNPTLSYIQASRIEKKPTRIVNPDGSTSQITATKVTGITTSGLSAADQQGKRTISIGSLIVTIPPNVAITPIGSSLVVDQRIKVFSADDVVISGNNTLLTANAVRIKRFEQARSDFRVAGVVSESSEGAKFFKIDGVKIDTTNVASLPVPFPAVGTYARARGSFNADSQTLLATRVQTKQEDNQTLIGENELKGSVTDFVSNSSFSVRGTPVDASGAKRIDGTITNGAYVEVKGTVENGVVKADSVDVKRDVPAGAELKLSGSILSVSPSNTTFTLSVTGGGSPTTVFYGGSVKYDDGKNASSLTQGAIVEVEGQLVGGVLKAREIEFFNNINQTEAEVKGVVAANATGSSPVLFTVSGVDIQCTPSNNGSDLVDCSTAKLKQGVAVEVRYTTSGNVNTATRVRLKN